MKCCYCDKSIKGSTDKMMSYRIMMISKHEKECKLNPKNVPRVSTKSNSNA